MSDDPSSWYHFVSAEHDGREYYYNSKTKVTQWTIPAEFVVKDPSTMVVSDKNFRKNEDFDDESGDECQHEGSTSQGTPVRRNWEGLMDVEDDVKDERMRLNRRAVFSIRICVVLLMINLVLGLCGFRGCIGDSVMPLVVTPEPVVNATIPHHRPIRRNPGSVLKKTRGLIANGIKVLITRLSCAAVTVVRGSEDMRANIREPCRSYPLNYVWNPECRTMATFSE